MQWELGIYFLLGSNEGKHILSYQREFNINNFLINQITGYVDSFRTLSKNIGYVRLSEISMRIVKKIFEGKSDL